LNRYNAFRPFMVKKVKIATKMFDLRFLSKTASALLFRGIQSVE
jgi:hypothetical protein